MLATVLTLVYAVFVAVASFLIFHRQAEFDKILATPKSCPNALYVPETNKCVPFRNDMQADNSYGNQS